MFCSKCSAQNDETARFCSRCGESINGEKSNMESSISAVETKSKKKKSKKLPLIIIAAVVIIVAIVIAVNPGGGIDYIATVGAHKPFVSQGTSLTYSAVLNKYIVPSTWEVRKSGDIAYVDISGTIKGTNKQMLLTISVSPNPDNPDGALISLVSMTVDGEKTTSKNQAVEALLDLFFAYEEGYDDISSFFY